MPSPDGKDGAGPGVLRSHEAELLHIAFQIDYMVAEVVAAATSSEFRDAETICQAAEAAFNRIRLIIVPPEDGTSAKWPPLTMGHELTHLWTTPDYTQQEETDVVWGAASAKYQHQGHHSGSVPSTMIRTCQFWRR